MKGFRYRVHVLLVRLVKNSPLRAAYEEGRFSPNMRHVLAVNWFFQHVIGVNRSVPWSIHFTWQVLWPSRIHMGHSVWRYFATSGNLYVNASNGIVIGDDTLIASGVKLVSANHGPAANRETLPAPAIVIGARCWLGANSVVLPGVALGDETTVGAGAVVTRSFPQGHITLVGVPAHPVIRSQKMGEEHG